MCCYFWVAVFARRNTEPALGSSLILVFLLFFVSLLLLICPSKVQNVWIRVLFLGRSFKAMIVLLSELCWERNVELEKKHSQTWLNSHGTSIEDSHYLLQTLVHFALHWSLSGRRVQRQLLQFNAQCIDYRIKRSNMHLLFRSKESPWI